jgi:hypothetical protein
MFAYFISHAHVKMLSVLTEYTRYTEAKNNLLVNELLHNVLSCNVLSLDNSLLWQPEIAQFRRFHLTLSSLCLCVYIGGAG